MFYLKTGRQQFPWKELARKQGLLSHLEDNAVSTSWRRKQEEKKREITIHGRRKLRKQGEYDKQKRGY